MRCLFVSLLLLLTVGFVCPTSAVHFLLVDTVPFCFVEEVGENTRTVSGDYTRKSVSGGDTVTATITVRAIEGRELSSKKLLLGTHSFSVDVQNAFGQYVVCVQVTDNWNAAANSQGIPVELNTDQTLNIMKDPEVPVVKRQNVNGEEVFSFREFGGQQKDILRPAEYIKRVESGLKSVGILLRETRSEIEHLLGRFDRMRRTSESTFTRIWTCGIITIIAITSITWLQFRFLKSTLRRKKLV